MSSVRDEILKKRRSMSPDEFKKTEPEETTAMKVHRTVKKIKGVANLLGIGSSIEASSSARDGADKHHNQARDFRESVAFNPSDEEFSERDTFNPSEACRRRKNEEEYLNLVGFTKDDLVLTGEEYMQRKKEDEYFNSLPGYRKKDNERDDER